MFEKLKFRWRRSSSDHQPHDARSVTQQLFILSRTLALTFFFENGEICFPVSEGKKTGFSSPKNESLHGIAMDTHFSVKPISHYG